MNNAETCSKPYRGYGNDLVQVHNSEKHLSLKKAFRLANEGRILWDDFHYAPLSQTWFFIVFILWKYPVNREIL